MCSIWNIIFGEQTPRWAELLLEQMVAINNRMKIMERKMATYAEALADMNTEIDAVAQVVSDLRDAIAAGDVAAQQAAADAFEAAVGRLKAAVDVPVVAPPVDEPPVDVPPVDEPPVV